MKVLRLVLICALALSFGAIAHPSQPVQAQTGLSSGCTLLNTFIGGSWGAQIMIGYPFFAGEVLTITAAEPSTGSPTSFSLTINGTIVAATGFPGTITYTLPTSGVYSSIEWISQPGGTITWSGGCTDASEPPVDPEVPAAAPVPGCDLGMPISATSVMGRFVADTPAYFMPGGAPDTQAATMKGGQSAWVLGVDQSGQFYQIVWSCSLLWVPVSAMSPAWGDALWQGRPLPTGVVE